MLILRPRLYSVHLFPPFVRRDENTTNKRKARNTSVGLGLLASRFKLLRMKKGD